MKKNYSVFTDTDGGRVKNSPKPVLTKHALPVVWFHEEPSLCCVTEREAEKTRPEPEVLKF
jgi:hypothetical protein